MNSVLGKTPEEDILPQDDNKKDNKVKVLNKLSDAPEGSQVLYLARIDLSKEFLSAVAEEDVDIPDRKSFAIRLGATKIGQSSTWEKFLIKMRRLQAYIPFATITYIAIIIPPTAGFTAYDGEQSTHLVHCDEHVRGEWYNLTIAQRDAVVARFLRLGCLRFDGQTQSLQLQRNLGGTVGQRGFIYFARFLWDEHDLPIITTLQQNVAHQSTCMKMLSVKNGYSLQIRRGEDVDSEDDSDDDSDDENEDSIANRWRGSAFVTFTSQLTETTVKAFKCNGMRREERILHNQNHSKWVGNGEWFNLDDVEVDMQIVPRAIIRERWNRRRSGRRTEYRESRVIAWIQSELIPPGALNTGIALGIIREDDF